MGCHLDLLFLLIDPKSPMQTFNMGRDRYIYCKDHNDMKKEDTLHVERTNHNRTASSWAYCGILTNLDNMGFVTTNNPIPHCKVARVILGI